MKKLLTLLMAVLMVVSLAACNSKPAAPSGGATMDEAVLKDSDASVTVDKTNDAEVDAAEAEIRYALGLLLDRNHIVENVSQAGEVPASSFVAMGMADYDGEFYKNAGSSDAYDGYYSVAKEDYTKNYEEALTILKKYYDFKDGKFTNFPTLHYIYNTNDNHKAIAEYIQGAYAQVGITVKLENQEWNTFLETRKNGEYSIARNGWVADYTDPICFLDMWTTNSGNNDVQYGKGEHATKALYDLDLTAYGYETKVEDGTWAETYDVLIDTIKKCSDAETRYALMHVAEDMLMETGCITPIYFYTDLYMISPSVEGFYSNPLGYKYFQNTTVNGKGDSLPVSLASEPQTLDPALNSALDGATMLTHLFSGLAKWAQADDGSLEVVADCAADLPEGVVNADGTVTYTYTLKDDLKWSDGVALTAYDFEFAWKRAASTELAADYGYMFEVVKGYGTDNKDDLAVKALDDKTLEVTLTTSITYWNELLAFPTYFPVREDVVANNSWATDPSTYVCNGAYKMTDWKHNSVITVAKNENYHGAADVTMNQIKFYLSDDANNMLTNYENGDWLLIDDVPTDMIPSLKANNADEFKIAGQIGTYYVCWNINESLLPE